MNRLLVAVGYASHDLLVRYGNWIDGEQSQCAWIQP